MDTPGIKPKPSEHIELDRTELWAQLTNAINLRSAQDQVIWSIFGTFWATNAILLVALFTGGGLPTDPIVGVVVGAVGMVISFIWHTIQNRAQGHIMRHEELMERLEKKLGVNPEYAVSARLNRQAYDKYLRGGLPARTLMKAASIGGTVAWFAVFVVFLQRVVK